MVTTSNAPTEKFSIFFCIKSSSVTSFLFTLFILFASPLFANNYYISSSEGSNANNGTSPNTSFKTYSTLYHSVDLQPGDKVLFKSGDVFDEGLIVIRDNGTKSNPIIFSSYGSGAKPILTANGPLEGWKDPSNWSKVSGNVWKMHFPSHNPERLWVDGKEVLRAMIVKDVGVQSLVPFGPHKGEGSFQGWYYKDNTLYLYAANNPARTYTSIEGGLNRGALKTRSISHIIIDGLDLRGGAGATVFFDTSSYITLKNSNVGYGYVGLRATSNSMSSSAHHLIIENNIFDSAFNFYYGLSSEGTIGEVRGNEDGILFQKAVNNSVIKNNTFNGWGHTAILMDALDVGFGGLHDNKVLHNTFTGSNNSYNRAFILNGIEEKNYNNEIAYNLIKNMRVRSHLNGNNNWLHHNIFYGSSNSPAKESGSKAGLGGAIDMAAYGSAVICHDNRVDHNIFIDIAQAAILFLSTNNNHVTGNLIRNNIFYNTSSNPINKADSGIAIAIHDPERVHDNIFQNNIFFNPGSSESNAIIYYKKYMGIGEFNKSNGSRSNRIENNRYTDPLFVNYEKADFHLKENSPAIDSGILIDAFNGLLDRDGNEIYNDATPDIGVYEYMASSMGIPTEPTEDEKQQITVYPNPFESSFTIQGTELGKKKVKVYNILGKLVFATSVEGKKNSINLAAQSSGIYLVKIISDHGISSTKLIKR